ncbi:hypothetical protein AAVH_14837 [Aphelenchoides avenae]|nr:hypothetical protein AAVH_14837 [Aphelenchus avenae]
MVPTWLALCFAVEYCFLLFHVSVAVVVARCLFSKKKPRLFSIAFSVLYLLQSVSDWGSYVFDCVVFRLMQYQVITRHMVLWLHYNRMHYPITSYLIFFQCFVHTAIAANRYTVIAKPLAHAKPGAVISVTASLSTCTASCVLELCTLRAYKRLSANRRWQHREDFRLLVYAMLGLVAQVLLGAYFMCLYAIGSSNKAVSVITLRSLPYVIDVLSLGGPICLFSTSISLRRRYLKFYGLRRWKDTRGRIITTTSAVRQHSSGHNVKDIRTVTSRIASRS